MRPRHLLLFLLLLLPLARLASAAAPPSPPASGDLVLPVEVLGVRDTNRTVAFTLTAEQAASAVRLQITANNLTYPGKGSIVVNGGPPRLLVHANVTYVGLSANWGGIGGVVGNTTFQIPATFMAGRNTLTFGYHWQATVSTPGGPVDNNSIGWRVVDLQVQTAAGSNLVDFAQDDPSTWTWNPAHVAEGRNLWNGTNELGGRFDLLSQVTTGLGPAAWQATCADCHARDGRDLKYFGYSTNSIITRAQFHGLTAPQGEKIAAYILSRTNVVRAAKGRPWNPPYQPGPGLDSAPVTDWAAGAGWDAVLHQPELMLNALHPGLVGVTNGTLRWNTNVIHWTNLPPHRYVSPREIPFYLQLADWNRWLPDIHPMDAFTNSTPALTNYLAKYPLMRAALLAGNKAQYKELFNQWYAANESLLPAYGHRQWDTHMTRNRSFYAASQLMATKLWELHQEFGLEDIGPRHYGARAEPRSWEVGQFFFTDLSPDILQFQGGHTGNGDVRADTVSRLAWYHNQMMMVNGHRKAEFGSAYPWIGISAGAPFDLAYFYSAWKSLAINADVSTFAPLMLYVSLFNQFLDTTVGPERAYAINSRGKSQLSGGWIPNSLSPEPLLLYHHYPNPNRFFGDTPRSVAGQLLEAHTRAWLYRSTNYTRENYRLGAPPADQEGSLLPPTNPPNILGLTVADSLHTMLRGIPQLDTLSGWGVSLEVRRQLADWARYLWPEHDWSAFP